jgi:hypothetical protein
VSSYLVLNHASLALRTILWSAYDADATVRGIVGNETAIVFSNPTQTAQDSANRLSLWMYQITENEFSKNQQLQYRNGNNTVLETPLALNLYYLITPFAPSGELDQLLLGMTLQVLFDNAIFYLRSPDDDVFEELKLTFCRLSLEELTRIWEALREPYRLSVCYQVRVARIDSEQVSQRARVLEVVGDYGRVPEVTLR